MIRGQDRYKKGRKHHTHNTISFATWNVQTFVENAAGERRTCRSRLRPGHTPQIPVNSISSHYVDRKLDFLVKELKRLDVAIAGIQETKWFGSDVWNVVGYTLLHSGRPLPDESEPQLRNEGVRIVMSKHATMAWKNVGESWEAISSRVVMVRLKVACCGQRRPRGSRETSNTFM